MKLKLRRGWCGIVAAVLVSCLWASPAVWALTSGQDASLVLGQADFISTGSHTGADGMSSPKQAMRSGNRLIVADSGNHRVLIYNTFPTENHAAADVVVGQPTFNANTANNGGLAGNTMSCPFGVWCDGTRLYVADVGNNRVLIYNTVPTSNNAFASVVVGQPNSYTGTANNGGLGANTLYSPQGVYSDGTKLYIVDSFNNRVLIYNTIPTAYNASANVVVGQVNFTSNDSGAASFSTPHHLSVAGGRLFVADGSNNRVLIYSPVPTASGASPSVAVGQPDLYSTAANQPSGSTSAQGMENPLGCYSDGTKLYVGDFWNYRILIYNSIPNTHNASADVVIGQPNMTSSSSGLSASKILYATGVHYTGTQLLVPDDLHCRVLIFDEATPTYTATRTRTPTATRTPTYTATQTRTPTFTRTPTYTATRTPTPTPTITRTATPTHSATRTITVTPEDTATPSATPTATVTLTAPPTGTVTPTATATPAVVRGGEVFAYPVPAAGGDVWFQYPAEGAGEVRIEIYNLTGERVQVVADRVAAAGNGRTRWDISGTAPGIYMYRVRLKYEKREWNSEWRKLVVVKK